MGARRVGWRLLAPELEEDGSSHVSVVSSTISTNSKLRIRLTNLEGRAAAGLNGPAKVRLEVTRSGSNPVPCSELLFCCVMLAVSWPRLGTPCWGVNSGIPSSGLPSACWVEVSVFLPVSGEGDEQRNDNWPVACNFFFFFFYCAKFWRLRWGVQPPGCLRVASTDIPWEQVTCSQTSYLF